MPRRIPDYPDAYSGWNAVSSFGSLVSVIATMLFIYIIYHIFVDQKFSSKNPWAIIGYYFGLLKYDSSTMEIPSSGTIEWTIASPAPAHAYNSLPVQSTQVSVNSSLDQH